jgi:hypothetical protein
MSDGRDVQTGPDDEMRAFLLGRLSDDRRAHVEEQVFDDEEAYDALMSVRYDLLDDYASGRLSEADRLRVEERLLGAGTDDTRVLAEVLARRTARAAGDERGAIAPRPALRRWLPLVAAAAVAVLAAGVSLRLASDNRRLRADLDRAREAATARPVAPPPASPIARVALSAGTTRGAGDVPVVTIAPDAVLVEFVLAVDEPRPEYRVALDGRGGRLWSQRRATRDAEGAIHVWLPRSLLADTGYELLVLDGPTEDAPLLQTFPFQVRGGGVQP